MKKSLHTISPRGVHIILDLYDCSDISLLNSAEKIEKLLKNSVKKANATLIDIKVHKFSPYGVSGFALISESHISIHTWPEKKYVGVDIYTCGNKTLPEVAADYFIKVLKSKKPTIMKIERGTYAEKF
ncbi:MAG: adenosylmethionine decarboxylase [Candidatus Omnitrophica bacterium]|nr:adenosylmethionine decarboxylase [Candidatus Omnitrophota bacterium]MCM8808878.1 adenosylmethionine decarboxylase [Candidatus Omnitrophota bacterium]MCM8832911.1 adenosylmethionine decarboxylase [Candidatus Omnitrophota bacterium]